MTDAGGETGVALPFEFRVAGTGYDGRYSVIRRYGAKRSEVRLVPERDNPYDAAAIAVHMLWLTQLGREIWDPIGYVPAALVATMHELIGGGEWAIERAYIRKLDTSPELDAPRVVVRLEGKDLRRDAS